MIILILIIIMIILMIKIILMIILIIMMNIIMILNKDLWPCEEMLSYYCLKKIDEFEDMDIIELGAGYSGLASIFLAR
jgi:hypothetical protein